MAMFPMILGDPNPSTVYGTYGTSGLTKA